MKLEVVAQKIMSFIESELDAPTFFIETTIDDIRSFNCQQCGHYLMARLGFKVYPCIHCKKAMKEVL